LQRAENDPFAVIKVSHLIPDELIYFLAASAAAR